jgi:hypothetical protein
MVGTYEVIGKGGAQPIANMAGAHVGQEVVEYARGQGHPMENCHDLAEFLRAHQLAGQLTFTENADSVNAEIGQCGICPKRVGKYQFDGTACPWGGILIGALETILHKRLSLSVKLIPAATCSITLNYK